MSMESRVYLELNDADTHYMKTASSANLARFNASAASSAFVGLSEYTTTTITKSSRLNFGMEEKVNAQVASNTRTNDLELSSAIVPGSEPKLAIVENGNNGSGNANGRPQRWRFRLTLICILICHFLTSMELNGTSTALPTIIQDLQGSQFIWVGSAYALAGSAFLPLGGALADTFGRRVVVLTSLFFFALGSALCGAATDMNFLIAGRAVQGFGAGNLLSITQIIFSDIISLRERGKYTPLLALCWTISSGAGPTIGGALAQHGQWRWFFYLNIPICAVAAGIIIFCVQFRTPSGTLRDKLSKIDYIGSIMFISSTFAIVLGLTWGGVKFPWGSAQTLVPLILGLCGLGIFILFEAKFTKNPLIPISLLKSRTTISGYVQTFLSLLLMLAFTYYLPIYFQACKGATPTLSGVEIFGFLIPGCIASVPASISVSLTRKYRPQLWLSWIFLIIGAGILSISTNDTSLITAIGLEVPSGTAIGMQYALTYFPVLAPLPVSANARAMAFFMFTRVFAQIWGITIGGAILQNGVQQRLPSQFLSTFPKDTSVAYSIVPIISSLEEPLRTQVRTAFAESLRTLWLSMVGFSGLGLLISLGMEHLPLHNSTDREWTVEGESGTTEKNRDDNDNDTDETNADNIVPQAGREVPINIDIDLPERTRNSKTGSLEKSAPELV